MRSGMAGRPLMETWEEAVLWLRSQPDQQNLVYTAFFDDPVSAAAARYHTSSEWNALRTELPREAGRALDLGAGRGIASFALAKDGWDTTAVEPDPSPVVGAGAIRKLVEQSGVPIRIVQHPGESLPLPDESFDLVFCRQALHHARDLRGFCREIRRVLRFGGKLIAAREHVLSRQSDLGAFLKKHPLHYRYGGEHAYTLREYRDAIVSAGLTLDKVLNPLQSDINTFPRTLEELRATIARRLHIPAKAVPLKALHFLGACLRTPGRLYTFVARK
jgi:SAM-dependent methyltransferase